MANSFGHFHELLAKDGGAELVHSEYERGAAAALKKPEPNETSILLCWSTTDKDWDSHMCHHRTDPANKVFNERCALVWHRKADEPPPTSSRNISYVIIDDETRRQVLNEVRVKDGKGWFCRHDGKIRPGSALKQLEMDVVGGDVAAPSHHVSYFEKHGTPDAQLHRKVTPFVPSQMVAYDEQGRLVYLCQAPAVARFLSEWQMGTPEALNVHITGDHYLMGMREGWRRSGWDLEAWRAGTKTHRAGVYYATTSVTPYRRV